MVTRDIIFRVTKKNEFRVRIPLKGDSSEAFLDYLKSLNLEEPNHNWLYTDPVIHEVDDKTAEKILLKAASLDLQLIPNFVFRPKNT